MVLTGTPAPNGYEDLYNLFKFIWPSKNVIGYRINQLCDITNRGDINRVNRLIDNIAPYFIRIKKSDLNIPAATNHSPIMVQMSPIQQRIYDFIEKKYVEALIQENKTDITSRFKAAISQARMIRLMQAASNPSMLKTPLENIALEYENSNEVFQAIDDTEVLKSIMEYENNEIPGKYVTVLDLVLFQKECV